MEQIVSTSCPVQLSIFWRGTQQRQHLSCADELDAFSAEIRRSGGLKAGELLGVTWLWSSTVLGRVRTRRKLFVLFWCTAVSKKFAIGKPPKARLFQGSGKSPASAN